MSEQVPVIIVGAGPVGLSLAAALVKAGIRVAVYEALADLSPEARASTFHASSLEMFAAWGVVDPLLAQGFRVDRLQYWERETRTLVAEYPYSAIAGDTPYPFRLQLPQSQLTRLLLPLLRESGLAELHFEHRFTGVEQDEQGIVARFETPQGPCEARAQYLCGADGSRSAVRTTLGFGFEGLTYEDRFLLIASDIQVGDHLPGIGPVAYLFDPDEWAIILHLPDLRRTVFRVKPEEDEQHIQDLYAVRQRMARFVPDAHSYTIFSTSVYRVHQRVADRLRAGRVLLLGDAAHINNPIGGMGMNSGIHDADMLSKALIRVLRGDEPDSLLDAYAAARRAAAVEDVQANSDRRYKEMIATQEERRARNAEYAAIAGDPARVRAFLLRASMLEDRI